MTYSDAALDAFKRDRNGNCYFEMSELVAHVSDQAKQFAAKLNGQWPGRSCRRASAERRQAIRCF
jgi:hypothetical protein